MSRKKVKRQPTVTDDEVRACVEMNRVNLSIFRDELGNAISLFAAMKATEAANPDGRELTSSWQVIAAKFGALSIFHFGNSLLAIRSQLSRSRLLPSKVDTKKLGLAEKLFDSSFSGIESVRHAIAHAGEVWETIEKMKLQPLKSDAAGTGYFVAAGALQFVSINGYTFSLSYYGEAFSVEIGPATLNKVDRIISLVSDAFQTP